MYLRIFFIKLIIVVFIIRYITIFNNKIRFILLCSLKKSYFVILKIECKMIVTNLFLKKKILFPKQLYIYYKIIITKIFYTYI